MNISAASLCSTFLEILPQEKIKNSFKTAISKFKKIKGNPSQKKNTKLLSSLHNLHPLVIVPGVTTPGARLIQG
jgi:hypothetical protein